MDVCVRKYRNSDYESLFRILEKVYGTQIDQATLEKNYITESRSILVASVDGLSIVGCAFVELQEDFIRTNRKLYITYVAVDEAFRKQGIGRKIFKTIESLCSECNATAMELTSADFRKEAHAFYNTLGFTKKKTTLFIKEIK